MTIKRAYSNRGSLILFLSRISAGLFNLFQIVLLILKLMPSYYGLGFFLVRFFKTVPSRNEQKINIFVSGLPINNWSPNYVWANKELSRTIQKYCSSTYFCSSFRIFGEVICAWFYLIPQSALIYFSAKLWIFRRSTKNEVFLQLKTRSYPTVMSK